MPDIDVIAFLYPSGGMAGAGCSTRVSESQYRRATNVALKDELPTTRGGVRVYKVESDDPIHAEFYRENNVQGALFFNPAKGQAGFSLAESTPSVMVANGGRKYRMSLEGVGVSTRALIRDISGDLITSKMLHLVWWVDAENYAIATDGSSNTFIYDGADESARFSEGYNSTDKEKSELPNAATVGVYAHSRLNMVVNARQIIVGDSLFKSEQTSAVNLLGTTEQVYWNTGAFFLPPSSMGDISAARILPMRNTQHGHGETIFHCYDGIFSLNTNISPRSAWATSEMTRHVVLEPGSGAVGPYAVAIRDMDQFYRNANGVTTLRSAAASFQSEGDPQASLSEPVQTFFQSDVPEWRRFCSVVTWQNRGFVTCDPCLDGRFRWHRGIVVRNFKPVPVEKSPASWEGLWTLPPEVAGIVQLVNGRFGSNDRMLALCRGEDGVNRVVEFTDAQQDDILEDGTRRRIRCQLLTRAVDLSKPFRSKEFVSGTLFIRNAAGTVDWGVWVRVHGETAFTLWRAGSISLPSVLRGFEAPQAFTDGIALGSFPKSCETRQGSARAFEFLIRWKGSAQIESLRIMARGDDSTTEQLNERAFKISYSVANNSDYDDFEYSTDNDWSQK